MRQPLLLLGLLLLAGVGAYRAWRYGGRWRALGAVPPVLIGLGCVLAPLVLGVLQGAGLRPAVGTVAPEELLPLLVVSSLLLAVLAGSILALRFRPP